VWQGSTSKVALKKIVTPDKRSAIRGPVFREFAADSAPLHLFAHRELVTSTSMQIPFPRQGENGETARRTDGNIVAFSPVQQAFYDGILFGGHHQGKRSRTSDQHDVVVPVSQGQDDFGTTVDPCATAAGGGGGAGGAGGAGGPGGDISTGTFVQILHPRDTSINTEDNTLRSDPLRLALSLQFTTSATVLARPTTKLRGPGAAYLADVIVDDDADDADGLVPRRAEGEAILAHTYASAAVTAGARVLVTPHPTRSNDDGRSGSKMVSDCVVQTVQIPLQEKNNNSKKKKKTQGDDMIQVGVNPMNANHFVRKALEEGWIAGLGRDVVGRVEAECTVNIAGTSSLHHFSSSSSRGSGRCSIRPPPPEGTLARDHQGGGTTSVSLDEEALRELKSRLDFVAHLTDGTTAYIEVKNVFYADNLDCTDEERAKAGHHKTDGHKKNNRDGERGQEEEEEEEDHHYDPWKKMALFPCSSVGQRRMLRRPASDRALRHIKLLETLVHRSPKTRCIQVFIVQRPDVDSLKISRLDPTYRAAMCASVQAGVEVRCFQVVWKDGAAYWCGELPVVMTS